MKYILCRYSEIALKKGNRSFFEECLIRNIKKTLKKEWFVSIERISGRVLVELTEKAVEEEVKEKLKKVLGIASFSFCDNVEQDLKIIQEKALELLSDFDFKKFRISSQRAWKKFFLTSQEINQKVGQYVLEKRENLEVSLEKPEVVCYIEIIEKYAFLFTEKIKGVNGLPVGSSGRGLSLLSGGIDSPVASFQAMRRGLKLSFVHFHSYPETSQSSIDKVKEIVEVLSSYQGETTLYLISISQAQKEIMIKAKEKLRVILYRRLMFSLAEEIALKENYSVLITGDSLGQVASQTVENLWVVQQKIKKLVLRPLVCQDKESIVKQAERIGTYQLSILPHDDCCSRFLPLRPETRACEKEVLEEEKKISFNIDEIIKKMERITINSLKDEQPRVG
jgi:tRNA uracil 4-sulfurtransferase